jgi:uncharacterized membrane protein
MCWERSRRNVKGSYRPERQRSWLAFGFPAFFAVIGILWLMLNKPTISLF